jgi:anti-sigma factor RsiW
MNEHFSAQLVERYRQRTLPAAELLEADDHLATCEMCRRRLTNEQQVQAAAQSLRADLTAVGWTHLSYERLAAYVEGGIDQTEHEIADSHLELCAQCAREIDELREFTAEMGAFPAREYEPAAPPSLGKELLSSAKDWWESSKGLWLSPAFQRTVRLAGLGLIVALLLWAGVLNSRNSQLQTALDQQRQENEKLRQDYQAANTSVTELQNQLAQLRSKEKLSSSIVVALNDGAGQVTLDAEGNVMGAPPDYQQIVKRTLTTQRIETPQALTELIGESAVLMGPANEGYPFALLGPIGTVVMGNRPTFRWRALSGADGYVVKIYDANFNEVAVSPQLAGTMWTVTRPLERGRIYSWHVTARVGDREVVSPVKPAPEARFMTLARAKVNELAAAQNSDAGSHLTLGILYAQAGLLDDAERELQALLRANPQSTLAGKLLRRVRAMRR